MKAMGIIESHCDMKPGTETRVSLPEKHKRSPYDAPFPCIFGSNSQ